MPIQNNHHVEILFFQIHFFLTKKEDRKVEVRVPKKSMNEFFAATSCLFDKAELLMSSKSSTERVIQNFSKRVYSDSFGPSVGKYTLLASP